MGDSGITSDHGRYTVVGGMASYETDRWLIRTEYGYQFVAGITHHIGAYFEGGYKLTSHWQPVFRYSWAREGLNIAVIVPDRFKSHREVAGGLNYWITPKAVFKFSYHDIDGNLLTFPGDPIDVTNLLAVPKHTQMAPLGIAFVF